MARRCEREDDEHDQRDLHGAIFLGCCARAEIDIGTRETRDGTRGRGIFATTHARAMLIYLLDVCTPRHRCAARSLLNLNAKGRSNWAIRVYDRPSLAR
jgi:hypothetical protein